MDGDGDNRIDDKSSSNNAEVSTSMESSEQPLLGSVTTFSNTEGSEPKVQQIRSSARVFKKMKLDLTTSLVIEKNEKKEESKPDTKRCYRPLWTSDDKTIFFEALCEFGKDFESIQMYISNKLRKKGVPDHLIKTKDQVRHLYYRSWNKISKYLKFAEGIKKVVQELYGLINYGELRKKIGSVSEKSLQKLNELIYKGSTMLRIKGKSVRVKTPMCKALRRLNQLDEKYDEIRLPTRVTVELRPKDMISYLRVQSTAQNPRLRTTLPLQKRLSSLLACINKKWKTVDARTYDKALISSNPITNICLPAPKISEANKVLLNPPLRLTPPTDCCIEIPSINLSEYFTTQSICLNSYENRIGITSTFYGTFYNYNTFKLMNKNNSRKNNRPRTGSISDKSPQKSNLHTDDNDICDMTDNEPASDINKVAVDTLKQHEDQVVEERVKVKLEKSEEVQNEMNKQKQARIQTIKKGWTEKDSESLTLGEIYLMFGADSKVILEYSWDNPSETKNLKTESNVDSSDDKCNANTDIKEENPVTSKNLDLSDSLSKLLSVAKLHYRKNIIQCTCGHVCGTKNNAQLKRAVESKIRKILTDIDKCSVEVEEKMTSEENMFQNDRFLKPPVYLKPKIHPISPSYFHHTNTSHLVSQIDSIQRLKPRYCNRRGRRPRSKQVVVERKLPLLPNKVESGHQIVRMSIISQEDSKVSNVDQNVFDNSITNSGEGCSIFQNQQLSTTNPIFLQESNCTSNALTKSLIKIENLELVNENTILSQPPSSPSRILKEESDNQWINSEVADYSLSSLLGHLESPMKSGASSSNLTSEDSRLSQDVDAQLRSLLTETSVDFSASFADLAAQVTKEIKKE